MIAEIVHKRNWSKSSTVCKLAPSGLSSGAYAGHVEDELRKAMANLVPIEAPRVAASRHVALRGSDPRDVQGESRSSILRGHFRVLPGPEARVWVVATDGDLTGGS